MFNEVQFNLGKKYSILHEIRSSSDDISARSFGIFRNEEYIPEYIPAILLLGVEQPEWKSRYSGMRIAPKQTLIRIIPIIVIPD